MFATFIAAIASDPQGALPLLQKYLPFQGLGLLVVLTTLIVLSAACSLVGMLFRRASAYKKSAPAPSAAPVAAAASQSTTGEEVTDPRVIAAIAAAITVVLERPYRIVEIQTAGHPVGMTSAWAIEGRFQHFSSHKLR
jgi:Na+-transporting methylmalonyl-CoA/oxaloacetate decarboxylase gamma subunit